MLFPGKVFAPRYSGFFPAWGIFPLLYGALLFMAIPLAAQSAVPAGPVMWGNDAGLYSRDSRGRVEILWQGGKVKKIIPWGKGLTIPGGQAVRQADKTSTAPGASGWAILTSEGIWVSENLKDWEQRSQGLPKEQIKIYETGEKSFVSIFREITDLEIDPANPDIMVCAVKDAVYLSRNGGRNWETLGMPNYRSNGIKAAASFTGQNGELTVICSHSIYGVYYINPDKAGAKWTEMNTGLEKLETTDNPDEISDFKTIPNPPGGSAAAAGTQEVYASQSFRRRVYRLDRENKEWKLIWQDDSEFGAADSLSPGPNSIRFIRDGAVMELTKTAGTSGAAQNTGTEIGFRPSQRQDILDLIRSIPGNYKPNCVVFNENNSNAGSPLVCFSELWLLDQDFSGNGETDSERLQLRTEAAGRIGLYLPVNHAMDSTSLKPYLDIMEQRGLNMVVIDMKDDYGRLRFTPQNPGFTNLGRVFRPVDLGVFLKTMKDRGIYTVARIVVFKDPEAAKKSNAKYAVWDGANNKPWEGYYDTRRKKTAPGEEAKTSSSLVTAILPADDPNYEILRTWYDEKWVDPYSEEIWDYNASIAQELTRQGFDEIQFDYIRFPTDGANLSDARFRWQENGMNMDSAILSFLRHVRSKVASPISVDIYGANGWYRTGARTGQEVELLAPWVDVICPMYYPSHFEQDFLAQNPPELRPYRIYSQGIRRTGIIARGQVIVRPWTQAFFLNVSYDRKYYGADYVRLELEGVKAAGNGGLTYWNNGGRYDDIPAADPKQ